MATRNVLTKQAALRLAGDRRRKLDRARAEHDTRIEEATAATIVALQVRDDAERALELEQTKVAESLRLLLAEDVSVDRAAALLDIDVTEVRRMRKVVPAEPEQVSEPKRTAGGEAVGRGATASRPPTAS